MRALAILMIAGLAAPGPLAAGEPAAPPPSRFAFVALGCMPCNTSAPMHVMSGLKELMLQSPKLTLAVAESMTCGHVQTGIGRIAGASNFFLGGITAYTVDQKVRHLGVDRTAARRVKGVSAAVAAQMAQGACSLFGSDLGVATTGYAEPSSEDEIEHPFAWWAVAHCRRRAGRSSGASRLIAIRSGRVVCPQVNRVEAQTIVAEAVIAELAAYLRELRG